MARAKDLNNAAAFLAIFAAGWIAEYLLRRILAGTRRRIEEASKRSGPARILPIITRALVGLLPLLAFAGVAYATALLAQPTALVRTVGLNFVNAYLVARVLMAGARLLLSPNAPALRLLPLREAAARDLFVWVRRFIAVSVTGYFVIAAAVLLGLSGRGAAALLTAHGAVLVIIGIVFVLRHRRGGGWLAAPEERRDFVALRGSAVAAGLRRRLARAGDRLPGRLLYRRRFRNRRRLRLHDSRNDPFAGDHRRRLGRPCLLKMVARSAAPARPGRH